MSNRLQVILNHKEYSMVKSVARSDGKSLSDWVRGLIRDRLSRKPFHQRLDILQTFKEAKLPAPSIEQMLREIEEGRQ